MVAEAACPCGAAEVATTQSGSRKRYSCAKCGVPMKWELMYAITHGKGSATSAPIPAKPELKPITPPEPGEPKGPFVLCRRDIGELGVKQYCGKPIAKPNNLNWCSGCQASLPWWPSDVVVAKEG